MGSAASAALPLQEYGVNMITNLNKNKKSLSSLDSAQVVAESGILTRREFLGFFLLGGMVSLFAKKVGAEQKPKEAMFWKRLD